MFSHNGAYRIVDHVYVDTWSLWLSVIGMGGGAKSAVHDCFVIFGFG